MANLESKALLTGLVVVGVAALLLSDPRCKRGCRTVAQHLLEHGVEKLFAGL
jgi:hypothetical protein